MNFDQFPFWWIEEYLKPVKSWYRYLFELSEKLVKTDKSWGTNKWQVVGKVPAVVEEVLLELGRSWWETPTEWEKILEDNQDSLPAKRLQYTLLDKTEIGCTRTLRTVTLTMKDGKEITFLEAYLTELRRHGHGNIEFFASGLTSPVMAKKISGEVVGVCMPILIVTEKLRKRSGVGTSP